VELEESVDEPVGIMTVSATSPSGSSCWLWKNGKVKTTGSVTFGKSDVETFDETVEDSDEVDTTSSLRIKTGLTECG